MVIGPYGISENPEMVNQARHDGWTPMHIAAHTNQVRIFDVLLKYKGNINHVSARGDVSFQVLAVSS